MSQTKRKENYEVGYGRPPVEHQFKKGQPSRNPRGRPPSGALRRSASVNELLNEQVTMTIDGRRKRVPYREAFIQTLKAKALQGDKTAMQMVYRLISAPDDAPVPDFDERTHYRILYKPEHDPLNEALDAWRAAGARGKEETKEIPVKDPD